MTNDIVLQLDPTDANPRNSEGSFVTLVDGRILLAYTRFTGGRGDNEAADIAVTCSPDAGRTWSDPEVLVANRGDHNTMSVSLLRLHDGRIALFYLVKNDIGDVRCADCRPWMSTSDDEGGSWTEPRLTIPTPGYFVVNNDRIIQLASGRLVIPAGFHMMFRKDSGAELAHDSRSIAKYFLSDDAGETWRESRDWWALPVRGGSGLQEPGVVELADGRLFSWCRTSVGCQYGLTSDDGGETWSAPEPTEFASPCSPLSIKRLPSTGHLLAVWNDISGRFDVPPPAEESWGRTPFASAVSSDEGQTWARHRLIEDDPDRGYCYTAIHPVVGDDAVLLAYCAGGKPTGQVLNTLRIRRVSVDWFYEEA